MKFPVVFIYEDYKYYECYNMDYCGDMQRVKDVKCKIEKDSGIASDRQKLFLVVGEDEHIGLETLEKGVFVVLPYPEVATVPDEEIGCLLGSSGDLDNPEAAAVSKEETDIHLDSKGGRVLDNSEAAEVTDEQIAYILSSGDGSQTQTVEVKVMACSLMDRQSTHFTEVVGVLDNVFTLTQQLRKVLQVQNSHRVTVLFNGRELEQNCCPFLDFRTSENWVDIIIQQGTIVGAEDINQNVIVGECSAANQMVPAQESNVASSSAAVNQTNVSALAANHTDDASEKVVGNVKEEHKIAVKVAIGRKNQYIINVYPSDKFSILRQRLAQRLAELKIATPESYDFVIGLNKVDNEELTIDEVGLENNRVINLISNDE
ncbi:PREDICTED: LOC109950297 [Prunus dulcis]|uniref:PREDICTED: LOC109950297 n=1 Tax=Prunus dulcis TaxID=3755 RepID=A0A5E4E688_PRUDU|nr:PREDICTED: LOC109950297 [Prunus dulcis]